MSTRKTKPRYQIDELVYKIDSGTVGLVKRKTKKRAGTIYIVSGPSGVFEAYAHELGRLRKPPSKKSSSQPLATPPLLSHCYARKRAENEGEPSGNTQGTGFNLSQAARGGEE
jgi:hypothetical protein